MLTTSLRLVSDSVCNACEVQELTNCLPGGSAAAAGQLVRKLGGTLLGYVFMLELDFLKGREKLDAPVYTLLTGQEEGMKESSLEEKLPLGLTKESSSQPPRPVTDAGGSAAEHKP